MATNRRVHRPSWSHFVGIELCKINQAVKSTAYVALCFRTTEPEQDIAQKPQAVSQAALQMVPSVQRASMAP